MKQIILVFMAFVSALVLVACKLEEDEKPNSDTVEITDIHGTRTVHTNPTRIAFLNLDTLDLLDSVYPELRGDDYQLGMIFKGNSTILDAYNNKESIVNLGTHRETDYDAIDLLAPQLIILGNRTSSWYNDLKTRYPEIDIYDATHEISDGELIDNLEKNAAQLEKIFTNLDGKLTAKVKTLVDQIKAMQAKAIDKRALFIMVSAKEVLTYGESGRFAMIYKDFKFLPADPKLSTKDAHGSAINYEQINTLNPDVIFILDRTAATSNETSAALKELLENELVKDTDAFKNDHIFTLHNDAWYLVTGGAKATTFMIEDINKYISTLN